MTLQRETVRTQAVVHRLTVAVRQKLAEMLAANGAFHVVADIERANQETEYIAQFDEPLTGKNLGEKRDKFLHLR